jgi:hypothetical protein
VVSTVRDTVNRAAGIVDSAANSAITWIKKHNQVIGRIGSILSNVSGALALAGLVIAPIPGLDFLTPVLEGAAAATALGALAAQGIAKAAGDRNITYGDLLGDALGAIPGGEDVEDAEEGLNTATKLVDDGSEDVAGGAPRTLFRADSRAPEDVFSKGFKPWGKNMNLEEHVSGVSQDSGYVATSKFESSARKWAQENGYEYVYKLRGDGIDVNKALDLAPDSTFYQEHEIAIPGPVPFNDIVGAWGPRGWIDNPLFTP